MNETSNQTYTQYLDNLIGRSDAIAIVLKCPMRPVAGQGTPVFPAIYAADEKSIDKSPRYCISPVGHEGKRNVCVIDSVQSQAGRIEAALQQHPYRGLTREVSVSVVTQGEEVAQIDVLAAGHRVFDAVFRYSTLLPLITDASRGYIAGDARQMAALAPMALIFGAWDSRGAKLQIPRAFSAEITAHDVSVLSRGSVYKVPVRASEIEGLDEGGSADGLESALNFGLGGVIATRIERRAVLSLATLRRNARAVRGAQAPDEVLRYLWALALVVATMPVEPDLRSGCLLVPDGAPTLVLVRADGEEEAVTLDAAAVLAYAEAAALAFGIPALEPLRGTFDPKLVKGAAEAKAESKKPSKTAGRGAKATTASAPVEEAP